MKQLAGLIEPSFEHRTQMELPEGWKYIALGDAGTWMSGGTPSKSRPEYWSAGTVPWVSPKDMKVPYLATAQDKVTKKAVAARAAKILPPGTVLFVVRGMILAHTFPVGVTTEEVTFNQDIKAVIPHNGVDSAYLMRVLQHEAMYILFAVKEATHGTRRLESDTLQPWPIPLPPLAEQRRIVEKIEALLAQVNAARDRLEKVPQILKRFRQSVLAAACSGKLTEDWRATRGVERDDWRSTRVGELCPNIQYGFTASAKALDHGPRFLRITDIQQGRVDWAAVPGCDIDEEAAAKYELRPGDIVFARSGATTGKSFLIEDCPAAVFASYLIRVSPGEAILPGFLYLCFQTPDYWAYITDNIAGNAQPNCNASKLRDLEVPVPELQEQAEIIRAVMQYDRLLDVVEQRLGVAGDRADNLTQAILAKAFRGELVPTEAELARQEGSEYEPASVLLERIQAQRQANGASKPKKKRRSPAKKSGTKGTRRRKAQPDQGK